MSSPKPTHNMPVSKWLFDDVEDADLILRSSASLDSHVPDACPTEFKVHKRILAIASPIFRDMFSLPIPSTGKDLSVVYLPESAQVIDIFLRFIYPIKDPDVSDLSVLAIALAPAIKYEVIAMIAPLRKLLVSQGFLTEHPLRVYAIATRHGLEEEAKIAATHSLSTDILRSHYVMITYT
jgi:BTB/POZ domain